jgi:hypothetical protein
LTIHPDIAGHVVCVWPGDGSAQSIEHHAWQRRRAASRCTRHPARRDLGEISPARRRHPQRASSAVNRQVLKLERELT